MDFSNAETIQRLFDNEGLRNILLNVEEYFDNMDLYVFDNWIDGEIVDGPNVSKYWVELTLKFDKDKLPDPRGTCLFLNQGTKIEFKRDFEYKPVEIPQNQNDLRTNGKPRLVKHPVVLIKFTIPRKLVDPDSVEEYNIIDKELEMDVPDSDLAQGAEQEAPNDTGTEQPQDEMQGPM